MSSLVENGTAGVKVAVSGNFRCWLPILSHLPGGVLERVAGCDRWQSDTPLPLFQGVFGVPTGLDRVDEILQPFIERGLPLLWVYADDDGLTEVLEHREFMIGRANGMAADVSALGDAAFPDDVSVRIVDSDPEALLAATEVSLSTNGLPASSAAAMVIALQQWSLEHGGLEVDTFLAEIDGQAVAAATLLVGAGVAGIYNVGTVEEERGRGIGAAITRAAMERARAQGAHVATLHAGPMAEPLYRRIGFELVGQTFVYAFRSET